MDEFRLRQPLSGSSGSTPLELVIWLTLLLLPLGPMLSLYGQLSDELAAESIARHALRAAVMDAGSQAEIDREVRRQLLPLAISWGKVITGYSLSCGNCTRGSIVSLRVVVGNAEAIQSAALSPK